MLNNANVAFITETQYLGKYSRNFPNIRTEIAWMVALNASHYPIEQLDNVKGYDIVFVILPKGGTFLNCEGIRLQNKANRYSYLYKIPLVENLKNNKNKLVVFIQEGPCWYFNDMLLEEQINYFNTLSKFDAIFVHNEHDINWYKGMFPEKPVFVISSLMLEDHVNNLKNKVKENKVMIGGAFTRWYGGFQSYLVSTIFECPIYSTVSHCTQDDEFKITNLTVLNRMLWNDWMQVLSNFKYAVNLMPTVAAGTFSLNCAYFGIPCIGNYKLDTQKICFPDLSVDVEDILKATEVAKKLKDDNDFYENVSQKSVENYYNFFSESVWIKKMEQCINTLFVNKLINL